jgi:hypothetical protein
MSDTSISNVMAIRAEVIARSRALREAQPTAPPSVADNSSLKLCRHAQRRGRQGQ